MNKKKLIGSILIAFGLILRIKGIRDLTFQSDVNLSTQWIFGEPNEIQMTFARNGQAYQDEVKTLGTIETVIAGVLLSTGAVVLIK